MKVTRSRMFRSLRIVIQAGSVDFISEDFLSEPDLSGSMILDFCIALLT